MIESMQTTINKIEKLPESEQKKLATLIEEELKWQEIESSASAELDQFVDEAISEYKSGKTLDSDW